MTFSQILSGRVDSARYLQRCNSALEIAQLVGDTAWKITALRDAAADAAQAFDDWRELFRAACPQCEGVSHLMMAPCGACGR